ncbi:MAG: winged helix-turn-helix domain-containing protein [Nanoarchaeota archaeon]
MSKRRSRLDIICDMLSSIQDKGGKIKPTHLMYKANLSHNLLNSYLEELVDKNMVKEIELNNYKYLIITDKGLEFIQNIKKMKDFQETFGI